MQNKLGCHLQYPNASAVDEILAWCSSPNPPPVILLMDYSESFIRQIYEANPDVMLIGRLFDPNQPLGTNSLEARNFGYQFAESVIALHVNSLQHDNRPLIPYWVGYNERLPGSASIGDHRLYNDFQVAFFDRIVIEGLTPIAMNLATGNDNGQDWLSYYAGTLEKYTWLGFHEYDFNQMSRMHFNGLVKPDEPWNWFPGGPQEGDGGHWLGLRYRRTMSYVREVYQHHKVVITEAGLGQGVWAGAGDLGWRHTEDTTGQGYPTPISSDEYLATLDWYSSELVRDGYVLGACLFNAGDSGGWASFEITPEITRGISSSETSPPVEPPVEPPEEDGYPIYSFHDQGGEHLMPEGGWVVITEEIGHDPFNYSGADYTNLSGAGYRVIVRLNNGYGSTGTIPTRDKYIDFATRVRNFIEASQGCNLWIIGNEMNHQNEWPNGQPIFPGDYAECFSLCVNSLNNHDHLLLVGAVAPWNASVTYPNNERGDWVQYLLDIIHGLEARQVYNTEYDISLHTYTHGSDPALISSQETMQPPFQDRYYHFYAYKNFISGLQSIGWHGTLYITEMNTDSSTWEGGNTGWIEEAYEEINRWNSIGSHLIRCGSIFRWKDDPLDYSVSTRPWIQDDFRFAYDKYYTTPDGGQTTPPPTVPDVPTAIILAPTEGYTNEPVEFDGGNSIGKDLIYDWVFSDGSQTSGVTVQHVFITTHEQHWGRLRATDIHNQSDDAVHYIKIADRPIEPPVEPPIGGEHMQHPVGVKLPGDERIPGQDVRPIFQPEWVGELPSEQLTWPPVLPPRTDWGEPSEHVQRMWRPRIENAGGPGFHGDNGRGIHWAASTSVWTAPADMADPNGPTQWEAKHLPFLREAKICWLKILDDGGGSNIEFIKRVLAEGIMPIVRTYRLEPYPDPISPREVELVGELSKWGVIYFEVDNEPDLQEEWSIPMPPNWLDIITDRYIDSWDKCKVSSNGRAILCTPAFGPGGTDNIFRLLAEKGRQDILEECLVAGHYYALCRPPAYPNDGRKDAGTPWLQEEYDMMTKGNYGTGGWGPALQKEPWRQVWEVAPVTVNSYVNEHSDPDITIMDDATCFRGFEEVAEMFKAEIGWYPPVVCTEGGYNIGQRAGTTGGDIPDNPKYTDRWQALMQKYVTDDYPVPNYYLTDTFWHMVGYQIGVFAADFEMQGPLFTNVHDAMYDLYGETSVTDLLRKNPGRVRHPGNIPPFWDRWQDPDFYEGRNIGVEFKMVEPIVTLEPLLNVPEDEYYWHIDTMEWEDGGGYCFFRCLDENGHLLADVPVTMVAAWGTQFKATTKHEGYGDLNFNGEPNGAYTLYVDDDLPSEQAINLGNMNLGDRGFKYSNTYITFIKKKGGGSMSWEWASNFDAQCLTNEAEGGDPINDSGVLPYNAGPKTVTISNPAVPEGQWYWKCIGVYHLYEAENNFNHNAYAAAFDENGDYLGPISNAIGWTWQGREEDEPAPPMELKGSPERAGVSMYWGQIVSQWCILDGLTSGIASEIHTAHPDDPPGNRVGHHSFYSVFQKVRSGGSTPPIQPTPPTVSLVGPHSGIVGQELLFLANAESGSSPIVSYTWDMGDSTSGEYGASVQYTYHTPGTYEVECTVTDANDLVAIASHTVVVTEESVVPPPGEGVIPPGWLELWTLPLAQTWFYVMWGLLASAGIAYLTWLMNQGG